MGLWQKLLKFASYVGGWIMVNLMTFFWKPVTSTSPTPNFLWKRWGPNIADCELKKKKRKKVLIVNVKTENYSCLLLDTECFDTEE